MGEAAARPARTMSRAERIRAVGLALEKRKRRLVKSMAISPHPRRGDLERWAEIRAEIAEFEDVLAKLLAGEDPPGSVKTGARSAALPVMIGQAARRRD